ncbi:PPR domain-containing protein/PPR_2 domain-containing protein [Cephalotus follicularis]|uniref:PPR domain-containing protein/PPR_2 domain-containing protein n=1 Tax=Cephalotus follicularis TaxID=3775 RepID=A0A1Q3CAR4_CEPFO|nr:PPR domain-containing protein/PPR_2 domain-containing protein [Cephalotus follicularis]
MLMRGTIACISSKIQQVSSIKQVEQAQAVITKAGLYNIPSIISKLITFASLSPSGSLMHAQAIFQETTMDNPFICNTMIRAYSKSVLPIKAVYVYNHMHTINIDSDNYTFNFVLKACARALWCMQEDVNFDGFGIACKGSEIHCTVLKMGLLHVDQYIQNSLLHLYRQCGLLGPARRVFDEMTERTVSSWNIMVSAYDLVNDFGSADNLISLMPIKNVASFNTLIARYVRLGDIKAAKRVFREMPERDSVSWNSIIAGYVKVKDYNGALEIFHEMQTANVEATEVTITSILGTCAEMGALHIGRKIHESLKEREYTIEGYLGCALVDMYAKCGNLSCAWDVFNELKMKHVSCWNAMIVGLAVHGYCEEALELFAAMEMRHEEVEPNRVTFIGVLIACSHKGLVEEGREYFSRMIKEYKLMPDIKHYGCMVDLLSRWGLLIEAYHMIKTMPFDANSVLWRTLIGACKVHGNVELAEECFQQLAKLDALRDGDYVLLSNIYAEAERWDNVEQVRNQMIGNKVPKKLGSSHIEMK